MPGIREMMRPGLLVVALLAAAGAIGHVSLTGAQASPEFAIDPSTQVLPASTSSVQVSVRIESGNSVAAFQFVLKYDPMVLGEPAVSEGPYLGSSGRTVSCLEPVVDSDRDGPGTVQYGCATTGSGGGASGSGVLATVSLRVTHPGSSGLELLRARLGSDLGDSLCSAPDCPVRNGNVRIGDAAGTDGSDANSHSGGSNPSPSSPNGGASTRDPGSPNDPGTSGSESTGTMDSVGSKPVDGNPSLGDAGSSADPGSAQTTGSAGGARQLPPNASRSGAPGSVGKFGMGPEQKPGVLPDEGTIALLWLVGLAFVTAGAKLRSHVVRSSATQRK